MPSSPHPAATLAAVASAAAGAIHAAAAGSHAELTTLSRLFAVAAVAQIGWAAASLRRPGRPTALAGVAINLLDNAARHRASPGCCAPAPLSAP